MACVCMRHATTVVTWFRRFAPPNRRGEVGVEGGCQAIMQVLSWAALSTAKVQGLSHAPCGQDAYQLVEVWIVCSESLIKRLS